jgi:hypothetical protein
VNPDSPLSLSALAAVPRWPAARTMALPGRLRGHALRDWGVHLRARHGDGASDRVRAALGVDEEALPDAPSRRDWIPISLQIRMLQAVSDLWLDGDGLRLEALFTDTNGAADKALALAGRVAGPGMVLRMAGAWHASVCDVGRCEAEVDGGRAVLRFRGAEVFDDPMWQLSQALGMQAMFNTLRRPAKQLTGNGDGSGCFTLWMAW